jgi:hypothetical protein
MIAMRYDRTVPDSKAKPIQLNNLDINISFYQVAFEPALPDITSVIVTMSEFLAVG